MSLVTLAGLRGIDWRVNHENRPRRLVCIVLQRNIQTYIHRLLITLPLLCVAQSGKKYKQLTCNHILIVWYGPSFKDLSKQTEIRLCFYPTARRKAVVMCLSAYVCLYVPLKHYTDQTPGPIFMIRQSIPLSPANVTKDMTLVKIQYGDY